MDRLGIEFITALGQDPADYVHLAADLGVPQIGLALSPVSLASPDQPSWSMRDDAVLYARVKAALIDRQVNVMLGEGFLIHPQMDVANAARDMDLLAELGTARINLVAIDPDVPRYHDQFALFAAMASERSMAATVEFMPGVAVATLAQALDCVVASGCNTAGVLVDSMHFFRSGATPEELAAVDPALIGHAQICDAPVVPTIASYADEARYERLSPGEGELPLRAFVEALPRDMFIGLEVPQRSRALAGRDHHARIGAIIAAARGLAAGLL